MLSGDNTYTSTYRIDWKELVGALTGRRPFDLVRLVLVARCRIYPRLFMIDVGCDFVGWMRDLGD